MKHIQSRSAAEATFLRTFIFIIFIIGFSSNIFAATYTWDGGGADNNWSTLTNWNIETELPDSDDDVVINNGAITTVDASFTSRINSLTIGDGSTNGSVTLVTDLVVSGNVTVDTDGTLTLSTNQLTIGGDLDLDGTLSGSSGTLRAGLTSNNQFDIAGDVTVGALICEGGLFTQGTLTITAASAQDFNVTDVTLIKGSLTLNSNITCNVSGDFKLTTVSGSYPTVTVNGDNLSYTGSSNSLTYQTSSDFTVGSEWPTSSSNRPNSVVINTPSSSTEIELTSTRTIDDDLTISSGVLTTSGTFDIGLGGALSTGTLTTTGSFTNTSGTSYIVMTGGGNQTITGGGGVNSIENLRINKTSSTNLVTLTTGILKVTDTLDVESGILVLSSDANQLDISGSAFEINSSGTYNIQSVCNF
jgi:hypothetical protein